MSDFNHEPVLLRECIEMLRIRESGVYIDGTVGGAGHSSHILEHLGKDGILIGLDQDDDAVSAATERLQKVKDAGRSRAEYIIVKTNFEKMTETAGCILRERGRLPQADGILLDIGVSSYQFDKPERGFSYRFDAPLDMRMNRDGPVTAEDVVNEYPGKRACQNYPGIRRRKMGGRNCQNDLHQAKNFADPNDAGACRDDQICDPCQSETGRRPSGQKNVSGDSDRSEPGA